MARRTSTILATATVASALLVSGCVAADGESVQIETSPETEVEPDQPDQEDGGAAGDDGAGALGGGDSTIVVDGTMLEFTVQCTRAPGDVDLAMSGIGSSGPFNAGFGAGDPANSISVSVDGVGWRADSDGDFGELLSLDVDVDAGTASGTVVFEATSGESSEGSFDLSCSDL